MNLLCMNLVSAQTNLYVSCNGKDSHNGTLKRPFLTLERALEEGRKIKGDVNVFLREGVYRLDKTIVLTEKDGNEEKILTIQSFPGEKATISSGKEIEVEWEFYKDGIYKSKLKGQYYMDMLIVDGKIKHMARYPNYDDKAQHFNGCSKDATSTDRILKWKNPSTGYMHAMHKSCWGSQHYKIKGIDKDNKLILDGGWQNNRRSAPHSEYRMVENVFEELDSPGEWFYDKENQILYYYPDNNNDINELKFESPQLKRLIEVRGALNHRAMNIHIKNLDITQTMRTFMDDYEPLLRSDWCINRNAAIFFENTERCSVTDCDLYNLGGNAVFFSNYNTNSIVSASHFYNIGASAVCFVGDTARVRSPRYDSLYIPYDGLDKIKGPKGDNFPANCKVFDNLIHDLGLFEKQVAGVELSMCQSIVVSHNSIYDVPRAGINVSEGTWGGHVIEFNDVFDTVKETGDHGAFNSWGRDRYWNKKAPSGMIAEHPELILLDVVKTITIRNNRFRCDHGWDIDLDDGSSNYHIYNNVCLNGGLKLREGFYRVVENNIIINNSFHPHVWYPNSGDVFTRNIVMTKYRPINVKYWGAMVDYNIFYKDKVGLDDARLRKTDQHSIVCDTEFLNPEIGDYSLPDNSNALIECGFHNFDMDGFGVVSSRLKQIARRPVFPKLMSVEK